MSIGYSVIATLLRVNELASQMGFVLVQCQHNRDLISLIPKDENVLPIYSRNAELFSGDLASIHAFLFGVKWQRDYFDMIKVTSKAKIEQKEQSIRNDNLAKLIKNSH